MLVTQKIKLYLIMKIKDVGYSTWVPQYLQLVNESYYLGPNEMPLKQGYSKIEGALVSGTCMYQVQDYMPLVHSIPKLVFQK
jgi:hypothetical protein